MSIIPLTPSELAEARRMQSEIMTSRARINQPGKIVYDPQAGQEVPTEGDMVYTGRARIQPVTETTTRVIAGGGETVIRDRYVAAVPWDIAGIMPGQILTITQAHVAETVGQRYQITSVDRGDGFATARRFHLELLGERAEKPAP
ncbi:DUF6093 family protein [Arachnia propionica]|uniref:DUF6093 family protein n=1 Tax=Arachnia propionica TaxID=1750 RepID=UPI003C70391D